MELTQLRRFPRTEVDVPATYEVLGKKHRARAVMLGGNGLLLQVSELLPSGTELTVWFRPGKGLSVIEARAQVRYQSNDQRVGLEFTAIKPEDRKIILGIVLSHLREKRIFPRRPLVVQVEHDLGSFLAFSRNISVGGMFVGTKEHVLPDGSKITIRFPLDNGGPTIVAVAEVRYAVLGQGMGVKFIEIQPEDLVRCDLYVTKGESSVSGSERVPLTATSKA